MEQRELSRLLAAVERTERREEPVDLADGERAVRERGALSSGVLQIALDAHRAEEEPADGDARRIGDERVLEHARASGAADACAIAGPS